MFGQSGQHSSAARDATLQPALSTGRLTITNRNNDEIYLLVVTIQLMISNIYSLNIHKKTANFQRGGISKWNFDFEVNLIFAFNTVINI